MRRLLRWFAISVLGLAAVVAVLVLGFGLHLQSAGDGIPRPTFGPRGDHYEALERQRAAQRATPAPPGAMPTPPSAATDSPPSSVPPAVTDAPSTGTAAHAGGAASPASSTGTVAPSADITASRLPSRAYWTGFRGPRRDGIYTEAPIRTAWSPANPPRILWKQPVGEGHGSFAAANGLAFTIEQRRSKEVVAAYHIETGREMWTHAWDALFRESMGGDGPRTTPTWDEGRVFALGATGELRVVEAADGTLVWRTNVLDDNGAQNTQWAMSASPLVVDDLVIVLPGGSNGRSVVAYDKRTGARRWNALDDAQAYTAPMLATLNGRRQLVIVTAERAVGLTLDGGRLIWEFPWRTDYNVNAAQPVIVGRNRVFLSAGYGHGAAVIELTSVGDRETVRVVWQNTRMKNKFASSVFYDGHIYGLDEAILGCVDAATGELAWKGGRYGYGQLILAGDQVLVVTERGELAVVKATPASHQELALIPVIAGRTWNHLALEQGRLLVRNGNEMAAVDLRP